MGKGAKSILGIVASIVVPFIAAPIAAAIGISGTLGSTLVGAALGAGASALTGGNPLLGALGGGIGGYMAGGGFSQVKDLFGGMFGGEQVAGIAPEISPEATASFAGQTVGPGETFITGPDNAVLTNGGIGLAQPGTPLPPPRPEGLNLSNFGTSGATSAIESGPVQFAAANPTGTATDAVSVGAERIASSGNYGVPEQYGNPFNIKGLGTDIFAPAETTGVTSGASSGITGANSADFTSAMRGALSQPANITAEAALNNVSASDAMAAYGAGGAGKGFSMSGLIDKVLNNPSGLAQLAMTMFNKPPQNLTAAEQAAVQDAARLASENQALFAQRVEEARSLLQRGTPNPEQAFAQTGLTVQRRLEEERRGKPAGLQDAAARRAAIEGSRLGTQAVTENARQALAYEQAGLAALPTTAPTGAAGLALPIYQALENRKRAYENSLSQAVGGMFGNMYGGSSGRYGGSNNQYATGYGSMYS